MFTTCSIQHTVSVLRASHDGREEYPAFFCRADRDVEIIFIICGGCVRVHKAGCISQEKANDDAACLVFDGRDTGFIDLCHCAAVPSVEVLAVTVIEITCGGVANAKAG